LTNKGRHNITNASSRETKTRLNNAMIAIEFILRLTENRRNKNEAKECTWGMPRHLPAKKDVISCEKLR
jgi:hypothetical protein